MSCTGGAEGYKAVVELVHTETPPHICWRELLALTTIRHRKADSYRRGRGNHCCRTATGHDLVARTDSLDVTFLYFGLFDLPDKKMPKSRAGFYLSGGSGLNPTEQLRVGGTLSYLPKGGQLKCKLLDQIAVPTWGDVAVARPLRYGLLASLQLCTLMAR
jgi:hypothetical protein